MSSQTVTPPGTVEPDAPSSASPADAEQEEIRAYLMDMWPFIPYYMAQICKGLQGESVHAILGSARYHLDRDYFRKVSLTPDPALLDMAGAIPSRGLRRIAKSGEYLINLWLLALRFSISRPGVLHVQYLPFLERGFPFEIWFLRYVRVLGVPIVYTVHNLTRQDTPERHNPLYKHVYELADALICHGDEARAQLVRDFGTSAEKIRVIPHGPLFDQQVRSSPEEARKQLGLPLGQPLALCIGVISEYKGIPFLLDAWKRVIELGGEGRLIVAGTGDPRLLDAIREKTVAEGLESSVDLWLRFIPVEQLPLLHQAADILVYPYKAGTTSGALLTGLNYGKPIVATKLPFFLEHLHDGKNAKLVDYNDIDSLGRVLTDLLHNPEERGRLGRGAAEGARSKDSWATIARSTIECYRAVLQQRSIPRTPRSTS